MEKNDEIQMTKWVDECPTKTHLKDLEYSYGTLITI
jgi:hypothetical protein